jgi:putative membrane protein
MSLATLPRGRFVLTLAVPFAALAAWAAVAPFDRHDWLLENVLTAAALGLLAATYRRLPLSRTSYALLFVYLCLHEVGSHYTYALVPYDAWSRALFGGSLDALLGWDRNNYDRLVTSRTGSSSPIRSARWCCASATCAASGAISCPST